MASKYYTNYAARQYADEVRAGRASTLAKRAEEQDKEANKALRQDTAQNLYEQYYKFGERRADNRLAQEVDGMSLYQEKPMSDGPVSSFVESKLPTKTEINPETAGKLIGGEDMSSFNKEAFGTYSEKDWQGLYKDVYSESAKTYDPSVPGQTSGYKDYGDVWKTGGEEQLNVLKSDMQIGAADKLGLQGTARDEFLKSEQFQKLGMKAGEKASKGLKIGEKLSKTVETAEKTKFVQGASKLVKKAGKVAGYAAGTYQAGKGVYDLAEGNIDEKEGAYEVASGAAKVAGTYLLAVPEPTGITKAAGAILTIGSSLADVAKEELDIFG